MRHKKNTRRNKWAKGRKGALLSTKDLTRYVNVRPQRSAEKRYGSLRELFDREG